LNIYFEIDRTTVSILVGLVVQLDTLHGNLEDQMYST